MTWPANHFTADDLDAFHSGALESAARLHLETCETCRELVMSDAAVLAAFSQLQPLGPRADFADRVMAQVRITEPEQVPLLSFPAFTQRRLAATLGLAAALLISVIWASLNRAALEAWLSGAAAELLGAGWLAVRSAAATIADQPWFEAARSVLAAPIRLLIVLMVGFLAYGSGLLALRRLVTPSAGSVSGASV